MPLSIKPRFVSNAVISGDTGNLSPSNVAVLYKDEAPNALVLSPTPALDNVRSACSLVRRARLPSTACITESTFPLPKYKVSASDGFTLFDTSITLLNNLPASL